MPDLVTVYHGTSNAFRAEVEDHGLRARPGLTKGTRISLRRELALAHAAAYTAFMMMTEYMAPKALLCKATIERSRIRESTEKNPLAEFVVEGRTVVGPALTVPAGIRREEISLEEVEMNFLFDPRAGQKALMMFERLTDRKVTLQPRRRS